MKPVNLTLSQKPEYAPKPSFLSLRMLRPPLDPHGWDLAHAHFLPQQAAAIGSEDLLVGISFAEYAPPVVEVVQDAQIRGVPTLTITDALVSPLAKNATVTFILRDVDVHRFKPVAAPMTLIQSMIIAVSYAREKAIEKAKSKSKGPRAARS